jgi:hypothetical protein
MADQKRFYSRSIADDIPEDILSADFFTIPAVDEKGHSARGQFRLSPELDREADELVASRRFPFRTKGDMYRWCVFDGMRRLLHHDQTIPNFMAQIEIINVVLRRKSKLAAFEDTIRELADTVRDLERRGARGDILEVLNEIGYQIQACIEADPYWGKRFQDEVDYRFGSLRRELERELLSDRQPIDWAGELRRWRNGGQ